MSRGGVTEHTIKLPDDIEIFYYDTGPVPGSDDYTTLVILHGAGFNAAGFRPMMEHAHQNNFRIIACNRRHYRGSTPYTDEELDDLTKGSKIFWDKLGRQLAWFLESLVRVENIPKPDSARTTGGVVLMAWSFGVATALINPEVIAKPVYETIEPYLRNVVLYDPPYLALGTEDPSHKVYHPWQDKELGTPEEVGKFFEQWVSSYYNHPDLHGPVYDSATLDYRKGTDRFTLSKWTDDERARWYEGAAVGLTEIPAFDGEPRRTLHKQFQRAAFDEAQASTFFPNVTLTFILAEHTGWHSIHAYKASQKQYEAAMARGERPRKTTFLCVEGGNHFLHYECPDVLLDHVIKGLKA